MRGIVIFCLLFAFACCPAQAQQSETRALALANGCKPVKIEIARQTFGTNGAVTYRVTCENKAPAGGTPPKAPELMIRCRAKLCTAF